MRIEFLRVFNGDSILISFKEKGEKRNILIDGGPGKAYKSKNRRKRPVPGELKKKLDHIVRIGERIDLLILTHVDDDHICGILKWMESDSFSINNIGKIWFNSGQLIADYFRKRRYEENYLLLRPIRTTDTGINEGVVFEEFITENNLWDRKIIKARDKLREFGLDFTILSPNINNMRNLLGKWVKRRSDTITLTSRSKNDYDLSLHSHLAQDTFIEDKSQHNGSSIAFLLSHQASNYLFLGDAHPNTVIKSIEHLGYSSKKPLPVRLVKVAHHGSKANTSKELLQIIDCKNFVISTDGSGHSHPHKQCLARIIQAQPRARLYFNYPELISNIFSQKDFVDYPLFKALSVKNLLL